MTRQITFITGNQHKADYLAKWLGMPVVHQKLDLDEIQSLDLRGVVEHKARQAYEQLGRPAGQSVLVEDVAFTLDAMGRLPGPLIKWFIEELGVQGGCNLAQMYGNQRAMVSIMYGLFDGQELQVFEATVSGTVPSEPRGDNGFGWNPIFIPDGTTKTYAEMTDDECKPFNHRAQAIAKLQKFLQETT